MTTASPDAPPLDPESRKAAAALSSLEANPAPTASSNVDQEALGKAMEGLGAGAGAGGAGGAGGGSGGAAAGGGVAAGRKVLRIDAADVAVLVEELEVAKPKATELLRANDGDVVKALRAFIAP
ncbi:MAG: hypothetical protein M1840_006443 [Geoglossum simile]|nr:MAG: hypothetical protein M1840_006443 [Geoglossum simile]